MTATPRTPRFVTVALAALLVAAPLQAQRTIGVGVDYLGYSFDDGLGATAAQLMIMPVALRIPAGSVTFDFYSAWAQGKVEQDDVAYELSGPVDTRVKMSYQATPWALLSLGVTVPTGNERHTGEEAVVAAVLSTDLLGFREATWGTGFAMTTSAATAVQAGEFGIGFAAAYSKRGSFQPTTDDDISYRPGDETRVRVGVDRNFGNSTFTGGFTFSTYSEDTFAQNLFQAGNRIRGDLAYAFRAGAGVWTLYAADLWRENGDLTLSIVDGTDVIVGDTTFATSSQNLFVAGVIGAVGVGSRIFRPQIDLKFQGREEADGSDEGSGWVLAAGGDLPMRIFGAYDFFPKARVLFGSITDPTGVGRGVLGAELSGTLRWSF